MGLPEAEKHLKDTLGSRYSDPDWQPALKAVMDAENDTDTATTAIEKLARVATNQSGLKIRLPARTAIPQLNSIENEVTRSISELCARNRIFGTPPTLDEFLEPKEELEANNQDSELLDLAGDVRVLEDGDKVIVAKVVLELAEKDGKVIDIESDSDDESGAPDISRGEAANLCEQLMEACLQHGGANSDLAIGLLTHLRHFRVHLRQDELLHSRQTTLNHYFASQSPERTM